MSHFNFPGLDMVNIHHFSQNLTVVWDLDGNFLGLVMKWILYLNNCQPQSHNDLLLSKRRETQIFFYTSRARACFL